MTPKRRELLLWRILDLVDRGEVVIKDVGPPFELTYSQGKCQTLEERRNLPLLFFCSACLNNIFASIMVKFEE